MRTLLLKLAMNLEFQNQSYNYVLNHLQDLKYSKQQNKYIDAIEVVCHKSWKSYLVDMVKKYQGIDVDINNIPLDDPETYKQKRENANGSTFTQRLDSDGKIQHWMYTFNAYETGVLWDDQGKIRHEHFELSTPIGQRTKERIDNVNGLYNMGAISQKITKAECLDLLAQIHSQLMYNTDNGSILQNISDILNIPIGLLSSIEYGIKSSAGISSAAIPSPPCILATVVLTASITFGFKSITVIWCSSLSRLSKMAVPTLPQPEIITFIIYLFRGLIATVSLIITFSGTKNNFFIVYGK